MSRSLFLLLIVSLWAIFSESSTPAPEPTCARDLLLFDFTTTTPAHEVKQLFAKVKLIYSFKGIGTSRHLFVVENDQSEGLKNLILPADASVNVNIFPVETFSQFLNRFNIVFAPVVFIDLPDKDLVFIESVWFAKGMNKAQSTAALTRLTQLHWQSAPRVNFAAVAALPNKVFFFWSRTDCELADELFNTIDLFGGPDGVERKLLRIRNI